MATNTNTTNRPTMSNSFSVAVGLIILYISTVNIVELELNMELREDVSAANITDMIRPQRPGGSNSVTNFTNARLVQPYLDIQNSRNICTCVFLNSVQNIEIHNFHIDCNNQNRP